jgi:putative oxidoreductase
MLPRLLRTERDFGLTILRLVLGVVMFAHGAQKVLGWYGGPGLRASMDGLTLGLGIPPILAALVIMAEFPGSIGLILGLFGRVAAFGIACVMLGAIAMVHLPNGFFMNWSGHQAGEGFELHLLVLAITAVLMWKGSGAWSLDRALTGPPRASLSRPQRVEPESATQAA